MIPHRAAWVVGLICLLGSIATPVGSEPLSTAVRQEDERLEKQVTLAATAVYLGEFLERLSRETGISLEAGSNGDGAGDPRISVYLSQVPVGDAMNALWSLVSYKNARWHWSRTGTRGQYRYRLLRTRPAQLFGALLQQQAQADFEAHAGTMLSAVQMSPEQQRQIAARNKLAGALLPDSQLRAGLSTFAQVLSPTQRAAVLRGETQVTVPVSQLPPEGQAFIKTFRSQSQVVNITPDGERRPAPEPTWVRFRARRVTGDIAPVLFMDVEHLGGYGCLGGQPFEQEWKNQLGDLWMLPGDEKASRTEERPLPDLLDSAPAPAVEDKAEPVLERRLRQAAERVPFSVMARLPAGARADPVLGNGRQGHPRTVREFLDRLHEPTLYLQRKWRSGILLLTYPSWFLSEGGNAAMPYQEVRKLREAEAKGKGFLTLDALCAAAATLSEGQLLKLAAEFPVMSQVAYWRGLLGLRHQSKRTAERLESTRGLPLADVGPSIRALSEPRFETFLENGATAIRLSERYHPKTDPPTREVRIELLSHDTVVASAGFTQARRAAREAVRNGGFEVVESHEGLTRAAGWAVFGGDHPAGGLSQEAHTGRRSGCLRSPDEKAAGMNYILAGSASGVVRFWYKALRSEVEGRNLVVYLIPMEMPLGATSAREFVPPGKATGRVRFPIPKEHVGDGKWHSATLPFDFRGQGTEYLLFAPRINELTPAVGGGEFLIDDVELKGADLQERARERPE